MPDEVDLSLKQQEADLDRCIKAARKMLPAVHAGDCDTCGEWASTLREGDCTPCREELERKDAIYRG
jgi:hypothetical protein